MIDTPDNNDVRPIRAEAPHDTQVAPHVTLTHVNLVPVDELLTTLHSIVYQAVAAAIVTATLGAVIGIIILRQENER